MWKRNIAVSLLMIAALYGCGGGPVIIKPNYDSQIFNDNVIKDSKNKKIVRVIDNRNERLSYAGTAQVGIFNKLVPYYLDEPVNEFVEKAANKIINSKTIDGKFVPVNVVIDTFNVYEKTGMFSEHGYFDCRLRFYFPVKKDSTVSITTSSHKISGGMDVTGSLEQLMYEGVLDCVEQFNDVLKNYKPALYAEAEVPADLKIETASAAVDINDRKQTADSVKASHDIYGIMYLQGDKIKTGIQLSYQQYSPFKNPDFAGGFGYAGSYYDIKNNKNGWQGEFISFGGKYSIRYYTSDSHNGLYFSGSLKLTFGSEKLKYLYGDTKTKYFFGPTAEEIIGMSVAKRVFFEAGLFQIKHFGSELMPDDIGFSLGFYFRLF